MSEQEAGLSTDEWIVLQAVSLAGPGVSLRGVQEWLSGHWDHPDETIRELLQRCVEKGYAEAEDVGGQLRYTLTSPPGEEAEETEGLLDRLAPEDLNALKTVRAMVDDELERMQRQLRLLETLTDDEEDGR